ncbi:MAG: cell division protein FtsA [Elusimicrobiaceae bacterium]|nr:cell division protein FtsA [Elusimicrobiaceae bacterium]
MSKERVVASIDLGGGRVTCVLAARDPETNSLNVLSGASAPCKGVKGGVVVDIQETAAAIEQVVDQAEQAAGAEVTALIHGVRGNHLESRNSHGAYNISRSDKEITAEDVHYALENAKAISLQTNREILQVIPQSFTIDGQKGIPNPEGMEGSLLEVDVHIISGSNSHLNNLLKAVSKAGFEAEDTFASIVPLCEAVLTDEEKELGAVLVDFGSESTSVAVYINGSVRYTRELPYGSDLITSDIAWGLHTSREIARTVKEKYAVACEGHLVEDEVIPVSLPDRADTKEIKATDLLDIVKPRVEELLELVRAEVVASNQGDFIRMAVLTGGGSLLRGIDDLTAQILGVSEVRVAGVKRNLVVCDDEEFFGPAYSTAVALVLYPELRPACGIASGEPKKTGSISRLLDVFKNLDVFGGN